MSLARNSGDPVCDSHFSMWVRFGEVCGRRLDAYASRESDSFIVVRKLANKVQVNTPDHGGAGGAKGTNRQKERDKPIQTVTQSAEGWTTGLSR
ncbi:hypothetical protein, partial [Endozoicomonas numazuensis]